MIKIAIDTGGTFTDYTSVGTMSEGESRSIFVKNPTDHENPARGILAGLEELAKAWDVDLDTLLHHTSQISHGTTLALNALLEKRGVKTALFTTEGFRDALEIRRSQLKNQWDLHIEMPEVLVPRRLRLGIRQRMDYKGDIITPLDEESVRRACAKCRDAQVKAIAVCFLFSFQNDAHERRVQEIIHEELPDVFVSLSSEVAPRIREYERTSTTVINAYLTPVLADYLSVIQVELAKHGWKNPIHIMLNSGGLSDTEAVNRFAAKTLLSGPAGGAVGNEALCRRLGKSHMVLADMGGTSFDVHVVSGGKNALIPQSELAEYPLSIPMIDINSIGAGGGSIARVDDGGRLLVGPDSAGSVPGPACYDLGGEEPTVTDALLLMGLVNENNFLGGRMTLSRRKAETAINQKIAEPLGLSVMEGARLIYRVAAEMMADALRLVTMQKGNDPRFYSLLSAGGAFPLFAAGIMDTLHMTDALIPVQGPVFCSWGMLGASRRYDDTRSFFMEKSQWDGKALARQIAAMKRVGDEELARLGVKEEDRRFDVVLEMRYIGQHHEISVPWGDRLIDDSCRNLVEKAFHDTHESIYEYAERDQDWEIINLHLACYEAMKGHTLFHFGEGKRVTEKTVAGDAFGLPGEVTVPVYGEGNLTRGIQGPALIDFSYTTAVVPKGFIAQVEYEGILTLKKEVKLKWNSEWKISSTVP